MTSQPSIMENHQNGDEEFSNGAEIMLVTKMQMSSFSIKCSHYQMWSAVAQW